MIEFPSLATEADFAGWRSRPDRWLPLVLDIARSEHIRVVDPAPLATGTNLVVDLDGRLVLKLFHPRYRTQFVSERATL